MNDLKDKIVVVTGGSRGIGSAIVKAFVENGATVVFSYRSSSGQADELVDSLAGAEGEVLAMQSDAASFGDSERLIKEVVDKFGRVDVLVNNAGITKDNLILRMNEENWDRVIEVNLKSVFNLTKNVVRGMMKNRSGSIINIGSVVGDFGNAGQSNYAASKAGIIGFSKSIAKELGSRNIRCNVVAPGFIETEMTGELDDKTKEAYLANVPLRRFGSGEEVAEAVMWLASDRSSYVNGQVLNVCGGLNT